MHKVRDSWYKIENVDKIDTPSLVVFPDRVMANILKVEAMVEDVARLRPHVKTHKSPDAVRLQLAAGISKFRWTSRPGLLTGSTCDFKSDRTSG